MLLLQELDVYHTKLNMAGLQWYDQARAKPFRTWKRNWRRVATLRFLMQRRLNGALFGAAMIWRENAKRGVKKVRLKRLALERWRGNACALAIVRIRYVIASRAMARKALIAMKNNSFHRGFRSWMALISPKAKSVMMRRAVASWVNSSLSRSCRHWKWMAASQMRLKGMLAVGIGQNLIRALNTWRDVCYEWHTLRQAILLISAPHAVRVHWLRWKRSLREVDLEYARICAAHWRWGSLFRLSLRVVKGARGTQTPHDPFAGWAVGAPLWRPLALAAGGARRAARRREEDSCRQPEAAAAR